MNLLFILATLERISQQKHRHFRNNIVERSVDAESSSLKCNECVRIECANCGIELAQECQYKHSEKSSTHFILSFRNFLIDAVIRWDAHLKLFDKTELPCNSQYDSHIFARFFVPLLSRSKWVIPGNLAPVSNVAVRVVVLAAIVCMCFYIKVHMMQWRLW